MNKTEKELQIEKEIQEFILKGSVLNFCPDNLPSLVK